MTVVLAVSMGLLGVAGVLMVARMTIGPTVLDRAIGLEMTVSILIVGIGTEAAVHQRATTLPILLVLTVVGFVGSASIARFAQRRGGVRGEHS